MKVTADDIAQLLAGSPPRRVPAHVLGAARRQRASWGTAAFGLLFAGFSLPFLYLFFPWRIGDEWRLAGGSMASGLVTSVRETNMKVNEQRVVEYGFSFVLENGGQHTGLCFANDDRWTTGHEVTVRYLPQNPDLACIEGARLNEAGLAGVFVLLFPIVGFGMVGWFVRQRNLAGRLLQHGLMAEVGVLAVKPTNMRVNKQPVYEIVLSTPHLPAGQPVTIKRVNQKDVELAERRAVEKQPVFVLYDPRKPAQVMFPEGLIEP